jgi:hypothetical protein
MDTQHMGENPMSEAFKEYADAVKQEDAAMRDAINAFLDLSSGRTSETVQAFTQRIERLTKAHKAAVDAGCKYVGRSTL